MRPLKMRRFTTGLFAASMLILPSTAALADTLEEALVRAYQTNPTLTGARAGQRANDENVPIARARLLPSAAASGSYTENLETYPGPSPTRRVGVAVGVDMPIYSGGGFRSAVRSAEARVSAGQANLRALESDVFVSVVTAYMDVLRDEAIVSLNESQTKVLSVNLEATKDRFEVGDITRTDVAQSEARLALSDSRLKSAEAQLIASKERYIQIVGVEPGKLAPPPPLPSLPQGPGFAVKTALEENPDLAAIEDQRVAAEFDVKSARSQRMPRVAGSLDTSYGNFLSSGSGFLPNSQRSVGAGVSVTFPIFQGGALGAQIRQSQARLGQTLEQTVEAERGVIAQTRSAFANWNASNAVIASSEVAVRASTLALEGVRAENSVGTRTILDILDAQQELLNSEVQLATARRNAYVAGFQLLASMGRAEYADLALDGGALYDPNVNYKRVERAIWDWKNDPQPSAQATRTVDTTPQTPALTTKQ